MNILRTGLLMAALTALFLLVGYLLGGTSASNPSSELYVVNNTLVSDKGTVSIS